MPSPQRRREYLCLRAPRPPALDGRLTGPWEHAPWTALFVDIEGDAPHRPQPRHATRAKMLWDDTHFYVAAELAEPHLWATLTQRDSIVYHDNDFEVFLNPSCDSHNYYELEINALGTVFDLHLAKPYRDGGPADHDWDFADLRTAIDLRGTLNNSRDTDQGWSVELAIPWESLDRHRGGPTCPSGCLGAGRAPRAEGGEQWRINFSRVQWDLEPLPDGGYRKIPGKPEHNWVWSPQGIIDMHRPEMWGVVEFSPIVAGTRKVADLPSVTRNLDADASIKLLHAAYYAQVAYKREHGTWASNLSHLKLPRTPPAFATGHLKLELHSRDDVWSCTAFAAREAWRIWHDSRVERA